MRTAVVRPEYFPGAALVACALHADQVVLADTHQYVRQSRQNRARLRTPDGSQWITIPLLRGQLGQAISTTRIDDGTPWQGRHLRAIQFQYGRAAFFEHLADPVRNLITAGHSTLGQVTCATAEWMLSMFRIGVPVCRASDLPGRPAAMDAIGEATRSTRLLVTGDTSMIEAGPAIGLEQVRMAEGMYRQAFPGHVRGLSSLDVLFNCGPDGVELIRSWSSFVPV